MLLFVTCFAIVFCTVYFRDTGTMLLFVTCLAIVFCTVCFRDTGPVLLFVTCFADVFCTVCFRDTGPVLREPPSCSLSSMTWVSLTPCMYLRWTLT